jgi:light-regulated signal transduction histidine kinase (bacteriophytochrome)
MFRALKRLTRLMAPVALLINSAGAQLAPAQEAETAGSAALPAGPEVREIRLSLFGKTARIVLSVGMLGFVVIVTLSVLLGLAVLFAWMARRRLTRAQGANRALEIQIRERARAEEEVTRLNAHLESRVAERTREVEEANQQLGVMNKELEAFAYSVSHDLRAPLRGIDGWSLALLEDYGSRLDMAGREYLDRVRSETQRMGALIDDLLQLSRVTRAEMQSNPVDLSSIAGGIAAGLLEANPDRRIDFAIAPGLMAHGDPGLLHIVLTNMLSNAVKFTGGSPQARIEFRQVQMDGESPFFVRDNGVGFDMAYAGMLFGAFQRLHKASEFPGTGVGLATVQRIVHRHGGRVWADAHPGGGATFYFTVRSAE